MSIESEASSQVVGVYLKGIEIGAQAILKLGDVVLKLSGEALHNVLETLVKAWRQTDKTGKHNITNFMRKAAEQGKTVTIYGTNIKTQEKYKTFLTELKRYGTDYVPVKGTYEVMVYQEDSPSLVHITEKMGINLVEQGESGVAYDLPKAKYDKKMPDDIVEYTDADGLINNIFEKEYNPKLNNDTVEYTNTDDFLNDIFDKDKSKQSNDSPVPTKTRTENTNKNRSEPISKEEKKNSGNVNRIHIHSEMSKKKEEHKKDTFVKTTEKMSKSDISAKEAEVKIK